LAERSANEIWHEHKTALMAMWSDAVNYYGKKIALPATLDANGALLHVIGKILRHMYGFAIIYKKKHNMYQLIKNDLFEYVPKVTSVRPNIYD
jgi:hypothetical protein